MQQLTLDKFGFKIYHHFVSENGSFVQNPVIQPTQLKGLSTSCCWCYRRETFPSFTASLSFKMKCMTGFLSLFSHWLLNKSRFKPLHANKGCRENTELNICFNHWQAKWNTLPVCQKLVMLYLLLFYAFKCHYVYIQDYVKWGLNSPMWFEMFNPSKMHGLSQVIHSPAM